MMGSPIISYLIDLHRQDPDRTVVVLEEGDIWWI